MYIHARNTKFYVQEIGKGFPIVFTHGGPGLNHSYFRPQLDDLSKHNKLIFYDQRACGQSAINIDPSTITVEHFLEDLEGLRQALEIDKMILLGHSWGAYLSMLYALKYPQHVAALVLISPLPASTHGLREFVSEYKKRIHHLRKEIDGITKSKEFLEGIPSAVEAYYRLVFQIYCYNPDHAKIISLEFTPTSAATTFKVARSLELQMIKTYDIHSELKNIQKPTLILHGKHDPISTESILKIHENIPNSLFEEYEEAAHFPFIEKQEQTLKRIKLFLSELEL